MADNARHFRPGELQVSKLHFYSLGIVASNKGLSSMDIEVTPTEELTMLDGEINSDQVQVTSTGEDSSGSAYSTTVATANSIKATWLKIGVGNRLTAPDVRRGAHVVIYQFGDTDKYYWCTLHDDSKLRKLETVIWGFSGTSDEDVENGPDNMYYLEISTHKKVVTFHTSKANGEFCTYDFQFNTQDGKVILTDDIGNWFMLDSAAHTLHMENVDGSIIDITKKIATITTLDAINMKSTNTISMETDTVNIKANTGNFNVETQNQTGQTLTVKYPSMSYTGNTYSGKIDSITYQGSTFNSDGYTSTFSGSGFIVETATIVLG